MFAEGPRNSFGGAKNLENELAAANELKFHHFRKAWPMKTENLAELSKAIIGCEYCELYQ